MAEIKLIAHRGLYLGPDPVLENRPEQVIESIDYGFDAEVDLWIKDGRFFLGHDIPQYEVTVEFVEMPELWIHAKNLDALYWLSKTNLKYFWHQNDDRVITSNGYIWTYPDKELTDRSIRLMPEWNDPQLKTIKDFSCYGICSDYVFEIKRILVSQAHLPKSEI